MELPTPQPKSRILCGLLPTASSASAASLTLYSSKKSGDSPDAEILRVRISRYASSSANLSNSAGSTMVWLAQAACALLESHRQRFVISAMDTWALTAATCWRDGPQPRGAARRLKGAHPVPGFSGNSLILLVSRPSVAGGMPSHHGCQDR